MRGGVKQRVVQRVLDGVGGGGEIEDITDRILDVIIQRRAGVDDVAVGGERVAVHGRIQRRAGGQFLAAQFLFRRGEIPAVVGSDFLDFRDGNPHHFVNRIRKRPVPAGRRAAPSARRRRVCRNAESPPFPRADGEKAGAEKCDDHQHHHDFDDRKTAAQRLGQRLRAGVLRVSGAGGSCAWS